MGFNMKGSPAKLGTIQGTTGHTSALNDSKEGTSPIHYMQYVKMAGDVMGSMNKGKSAPSTTPTEDEKPKKSKGSIESY